jgi:toxin FitB
MNSSRTSTPPGIPGWRELIVVDTNVASPILKARLADPPRSRLAGHSLCITFVTLGELTKWKVRRDWG